MKIQSLLISAAALGLAGCDTVPPPAAPIAPLATATITTATKAPFGTYLVDGAGRSLYILEATRGGTGINRCSGPCLGVWPPLLTGPAPTTASGLDPGQLRTVQGYGGAQASYAGWPLYYYSHDRASGDTTGQHVIDTWGTWHLLAPSGEPIRPAGGY
jgi:predicted lipoprotein with Yx(FWY)xxD motif